MTSPRPVLTVRYTVEELTVIADLLDLGSLPGTARAELTNTTRGLATRCLIARNVVGMPPDGGVEIQQPHATLFDTLLHAPDVVQILRHRPAITHVDQWFTDDRSSVQVSELDGIVTIALYDQRVTPATGTTLADLPAGSEIAAFDEVLRLRRTDGQVVVDRTLTMPVG